MKEALTQAGIQFDCIDITSGIMPLKKFLKLRDTRPEFDEIRAKNRVGVPMVMFEDKIYFDLPEDLSIFKNE